MKYLLVIFFTFVASVSFGQRFYNIQFDELPQDFQLYPRDDKNRALVPISGQIEVENWSYMSVIVYRNKQFYSYTKNYFTYDNTGKKGIFSLKPIIKAELAEYDFKIYASQAGKDSILTFERKNVVSGDAYLIYGQSNGRAWEEKYDYENEYCRTFGYGSFKYGYTWGLSNVGFTGGFDGEQFIVGEWGIHFQKNILENYGIPSCIINASTSGANIKTLSDRNESNPSDIETHYGRLLYLAQKSGIINNIKGFFYWQAETDAAQAPSLWKPGFDKLYNFWAKDLPSVKKIYTFQIPLFGAGDYNDEVGVLRDYLRQLGNLYPKITTYAPLGVRGWNGWHFDLAGYKQIANELSKIVGKDFYGEQKTLISPNIQKTYYSKANRSEITLSFENGQQMIYPKDTIAPNIGGGFGTYSLKDFFYLNGVWQKVQSGRAEGNKIILTLKQPANTNDTLIKYLPSVYPYSSGSYILQEAPWIYIGPFLKNTDGMRAFAFHHLKIAPFVEFEKIILTNTVTSGKNNSLKWNAIDKARAYILERILAKDTLNIQLVKQFSTAQTTFIDSTTEFNEEYIYRIKAVSDLQESNFTLLKVKIPNNPNSLSLTLNSQVNYYNSVKLNWVVQNLNQKPEYYTIERKMGQIGAFTEISKVSGSTLTFKDSTLLANTEYYYRIQSSVVNNVILQAQTNIKTPELLNSPQLNSDVITNESIKVTWKPVPNATKYVLEKQSLIDLTFKKVFETSNIFEYVDNQLKSNQTYSYRLKAFSDISESGFVKIDAKTLVVLANQNEENDTFIVFPNPSREKLNITLVKPVSGELTIIDLTGSSVLSRNIEKRSLLNIDVSGLKKGVYFIIIEAENKVYSKKIIIE